VLSESLVEPTVKAGPDELLEQIARMVRTVGAAVGPLVAVGVGVPSVVEFATGRVVSSVNVPLRDLPLRRMLTDRVGVPAFIDNDATVAAFAEAHDEGFALVSRNLVMLTVGTGVGGGIVLEGRIYRGATGAAAELGHTIVGLDLAGAVPAPMGFPQPGSLEFVASGHALDRLAAQSATLHPHSELGRLHAAGKPVLGADAVQAAREGDEAAARMVEIWGQRIGIGIANAMNTFDPEEVVIGGGAGRAGELLLKPATRVARGYVLPGIGGACVIRLARHGVRAGVLGAALLARYELEAAG
jgi:glucokinase